MSSVLHVLISIPGEHLCGTVQCAVQYGSQRFKLVVTCLQKITEAMKVNVIS